MAESVKNKAVKGVMWSAIERFSVQFVQLIIQILIARILSPDDFGIIGMIAIFIAIAQSFIDSGFSNALIRKRDRTDIDNSTVFYFNIVVGAVFYLLLYLCAPAIAKFYNTPILVPVTRIVGLGVIFNSLAVVQRANLTAKVDFKTQAKASLISVIISGGCGLFLAYKGFGVWSLVAQTLLNGGCNTIFLWIFAKWYPKWVFSWKSFREMFSFGSKLLLSGLMDTLYKNIYTIVIGKFYSAGDLGYFTKANQLASFPSSNITGILQRVTYPLLCENQGNKEVLRTRYRTFLRLSAYVVFPLMVGLAVLAEPLIETLLTDKWIAAVPLLQLLCLSMMWYPIHAINLNLLQVQGRSDLFLRLEVIKKIVGVSILCITIPMGVVWMCVGKIVVTIIALIINTHYTGKLIGLGFLKQMRDLLPSLVYSFLMGAAVMLITMVVDNNILQIIIGIAVGVVVYFVMSKITRSEEYKTLMSLVHKK